MAEQGDDWLAMFGVGYDLWRERQLMARDTVGMSPQRFGLSMMAVLPPCLDLEPDLCVCGLPVWIPDEHGWEDWCREGMSLHPQAGG